MGKLRHAAVCLLLAAGNAPASDLTYLMPGSRQNAMGGAFSSVANDPYAVFYNPAGLSSLANIEAGITLGRRMSPLAGEGETALAYARPSPDKAGQVAGFGYYAVRQGVRGSLDTLAFELGRRTTFKYFQKPILYGGGVKLVNLRTAQKSHIGLGLDGGFLLGSDAGLQTALVLTDAVFGLGRALATVTLGNSYRYKNALFALDLRARGAYSEFFMGAEQTLFNGLLQARAGKGFSLDGSDYLALGLGLNTLPLTIDLAWSLPWKGFNEQAGFYGLSAAYRFGAPTFSEKFVGEAARRAEEIKNQVNDLRVQRTALEHSVATYRVNKSVLESDLTIMQTRLRDLETQLRDLELQILDAQSRKDNGKPEKRYVPPPAEKWPRLHKVTAGETLRSIASRYYGNPALWERLYEANEKNISKGLPIEGSVFTIPPPPPAGPGNQ